MILKSTQPPSTTTTSTTTTPPPTLQTPYYDPCEFYDDIALLNKLKQSGLFNSIYMAPDVFTAAKTFPDLGDRSFTISGGHKYECDEQCENESKIIRGIIGSNTRRTVQRSQILRNSRFRNPPKVTEAPRTWWRPANWRREKRENER
uniref:Uncharacterized protein n=1 Tax=Panagrolaimus sp. PS1159 TaxID=55785 RepID=A0AC35EUU9_9BILA